MSNECKVHELGFVSEIRRKQRRTGRGDLIAVASLLAVIFILAICCAFSAKAVVHFLEWCADQIAHLTSSRANVT
jgi:hypothetical protein